MINELAHLTKLLEKLLPDDAAGEAESQSPSELIEAECRRIKAVVYNIFKTEPHIGLLNRYKEFFGNTIRAATIGEAIVTANAEISKISQSPTLPGLAYYPVPPTLKELLLDFLETEKDQLEKGHTAPQPTGEKLHMLQTVDELNHSLNKFLTSKNLLLPTFFSKLEKK